MKKLSLLLAALTVMFAASAITPISSNIDKHAMKINKVRSLVKQDAPRMGDVVTAQPEGTLMLLTRGSEGCYIYSNNGSVYIDYQGGNVMAVMSEDGKTMWIKDLIAGAATGAWVKGEISEDGKTLVVPMDQAIYHGSYTDEQTGEVIEYDVLLGWNTSEVVYDEEGNAKLQVTRDERTTEAEFSIEGNVLTLLHSDGVTTIDASDFSSYEATGLGLYYSDDLMCMSYLDWNTTFTNQGPIEIPEIITEQPEGDLVVYNRYGNTLALESFWFWYFVTPGTQDGKVNVVYAPDGKTVYIQHILNGYDDAITSWVKGEIGEDGNIHVPAGQYIYWSDEYMAGVILTMGDVEATVDAEGFTSAVPTDDEIVFQVSDNTLTLLNSSAEIVPGEEGDTYYVHGLTGTWSDGDAFTSIDWNSQFIHLIATPAVPANPTDVIWQDDYNEDGYSNLSFVINLVDVDGNPLVDDNVYYRIYTDNDQIFTFDPVTYAESNVTEEMTDVPYNFSGYDINGKSGVVYFYRTLYNDNPFFNERIGIQVVYKVGDTENVSDIVYWYRPVVQAAVPADPEALNWYDSGAENGYSRFEFNINLVDVNGNALDPYYVTYRIYTDNDELFTFDAATYSYDLEQDITDVPYILSGYDFGSGRVYFYRTNQGDNPLFNERIGIQVIYTVDGEANESNIVYWYLPTPEPVDPVTPANPIVINWHDCGNESGNSYLDFQMIYKDVDGNELNPANFSYSIFLDDDQIYTFDASLYDYDLTTNRTEIPYSIWSQGFDIQETRAYFYATNTGDSPLFNNRIGIQVYYRVNGQLAGQSEIIYLDKDVAVNELNAGKTVANVRYFNVAGQEMAQPQGMTIQVTTYTDGTTSAVKVMK